MPDASQILKGLLEGCVLSVVDSGDFYGWEIIKHLGSGGFPAVGEGSVYPILLRLEQKGLVAFAKKPSPLGPARKYYRLTAEGQAVLSDFKAQWRIVRTAVDGFIEKEDAHA